MDETVDGEPLTHVERRRVILLRCPVCSAVMDSVFKCPGGHGGPLLFVSIPPPYREGHDTRSPAPGEPAPPRTTPIPAAPSPATGVGGGGATPPTVPNRLDCGPDPEVTIREVVSRMAAVMGSIIEACNEDDRLAETAALAAGALDALLDEIDHVYPTTETIDDAF